MKKTYMTPVISIEHYELTQSIAACEIHLALNNSACIMKSDDVTDQYKDLALALGWFVSGICNEAAQDMDTDDNICVHTNASALFKS